MATLTLGHRDFRFLLAGGAVALVLSGTAIAITEKSFRYSEPKTAFYVVSPTEMQAGESYVTYHRYPSYLVIDGSDIIPHCFYASLRLPQGATILTVTTYYSSLNTYRDMSVSMSRREYRLDQSIDTESDTLFARVIDDDTGRPRYKTDIVPHKYSVIRNNQYIYSYVVCMNRDSSGDFDRFLGAGITYQYSSAGD